MTKDPLLGSLWHPQKRSVDHAPNHFGYDEGNSKPSAVLQQ